MTESWRRMAQTAQGEALVQQAAQAFYAEGRWPLLALAQREGEHVRLICVCHSGQTLAPIEYRLEHSPCRSLYQSDRPLDSLIFYPQLKHFSQWPLAKQFELGCYLGRRLDLPDSIGEFHLFIMDKLSRAEQELPRRLLITASERLSMDIKRQTEHQELIALRQLQHNNPFAFARLCPSGRLHQVSEGFAEQFARPMDELNGAFLSDLVELGPNLALRDLLTAPAGLRRPCRLKQPNGQLTLVELSLTPVDSQLGHLLTLVPAPEGQNSGFEHGSLGDETLLHDRVQHELARLHRNHQVAALFFIGVEGHPVSQAQWKALNTLLRPLLRSEDLVAQRDEAHLAVLTACFDNKGQPPREQMNAIARKLYDQLRDWLPHGEGQLLFKSRLLTAWDKDPAQILDPELATTWVLPDADDARKTIR
ncbi:hypothetical protein [Ferrimonas balearica]|uniref:hypothetical protein n=1 Tax=Ferrimonas balearica TaxID=44012 RepID=UPI001C99A37A|nr:hypothetical protein [Ferrimonas balearica]MBY5920375.1 hypothetical protein [Ferrimonas balearica]MBY5996940.1 hypothetical protein [Ferrimonas balearica]